jgi:hypothetical protein
LYSQCESLKNTQDPTPIENIRLISNLKPIGEKNEFLIGFEEAAVADRLSEIGRNSTTKSNGMGEIN